MDALGVDRFGIMTQSGGTPYGIAVAGAVPERGTAHSLLGAIAPLAEKAQWRAAGKDMKMAAFMSRRHGIWTTSASGPLNSPIAEFIEEVRNLCNPWGITPGAVRASLWTGEFDRMHPPSHARRVAELLGGDPPVTVVPGVEQIGLLVIFEEALRFATFSGP